MDPGRLEPIWAGFRVGILTDQFLNTSDADRHRPVQARAIRRLSARGAATPILAHLLRKHSSNEARIQATNRSTSQEHTMIAATAFAVVGLVVVAFLNRIP
jgi:hypothetical protein